MLHQKQSLRSYFQLLVIVCLFMAACGPKKDATPDYAATEISGYGPKATSDAMTAEASSGLDNSTPVSASHTIADMTYTLYPISQETNDGWTKYLSALIIHNNGEWGEFLQIIESEDFLNPFGSFAWMTTSILIVGNSTIETSEGKSYPIDEIRGGNGAPVPEGFSSGVAAFVYRVPEKLHPTQMVLKPGIAGLNSKTYEPIVADISQTEFSKVSGLNTVNGHDLPVNFALSDAVTMHVEPAKSCSEVVDVGDCDYYKLSSALPVSFANSDITDDQNVNALIYFVDDRGEMYTPRQYFCDDVPSTIGPGQTKTGNLCFDTGGKTGKFYLMVMMMDTSNELHTQWASFAVP